LPTIREGGISVGSRFFITGVQMGIIIASLEHLDLAQVCRTLCDIKENQFIGNIEDPKIDKVAVVQKPVIAGK
jgi:hypothetical protein